MRKIIAISILGFVICTAFNKPMFLFTDYRDAYTGTYFCKSACSNKDGVTRESVNTTDTLSIAISKDAADSVLQIKLGTNILKVKLLNKNLTAFQAGSHYGGNFFASDSLDFIFASGRTSSCKYIGKKK